MYPEMMGFCEKTVDYFIYREKKGVAESVKKSADYYVYKEK